jgi:hypothetical protein
MEIGGHGQFEEVASKQPLRASGPGKRALGASAWSGFIDTAGTPSPLADDIHDRLVGLVEPLSIAGGDGYVELAADPTVGRSVESHRSRLREETPHDRLRLDSFLRRSASGTTSTTCAFVLRIRALLVTSEPDS